MQGGIPRATFDDGISLDRLLVHIAGFVSEKNGSSMVDSRQWAATDSL